MKKLFTLLTAALLTLSVTAGEITVADGSATHESLPIDAYYGDVANAHSQMIYPASMLTQMEGASISSLTFYVASKAKKNLTAVYTVSLGIVADDHYADSQPGSSAEFKSTTLTAVYVGAINMSQSQVTLNFTAPFTYSGGNLLIDIVNTTKGNYEDGLSFVGQATGAKTSIYYKSYGGKEEDFMPKTTFEYGGGADVTCAEPTQLKSTITPDGGVFAWTAEVGAQHQYCAVLKDTVPADDDWTLLDANVFTCTVTGLTTGTEYDFHVRTYCSETSQSASYKRSFTPVCETPANLTLIDMERHTATLAWEAVAGVSKYQYICVEHDSTPSWEGVQAQAGLSASLSLLYANTAYDFYVRSYFSASVQSAAAKLTFRTDCEAKTIPWREAFLKEELPDCWRIANHTSYGWKVYDATANSDDMASICMRFNANGASGQIDTLELPVVNLSEAACLKMDIINKQGVEVSLYISTDGGNTRQLVEDLSEVVSEKTNRVIDLSRFSGEANLYLYGTAKNKSHYFDFDNLQLRVAESHTAIDNTNVNTKATKFMENGQLLIEHNGIRYNAQGALVQ